MKSTYKRHNVFGPLNSSAHLTKALNKTVWFVQFIPRSRMYRCPCKLPGVETVRVTHAGRIVCRLLRDASVIWVKMNKWTRSWWRGLFPLRHEYRWITAKITNKYKILMMPVGEIRALSVKGLLGCGWAVTPFYSLQQLKPRALEGESFARCMMGDCDLPCHCSLLGFGRSVCFKTSGFLNDFTWKGEQKWHFKRKLKYVVQYACV